MIINKVILDNFGIFLGTTSFDFTVPEESKNIILIGGKNGSGKTTILEAVKLALYGPLALGLKSPTTTYYDYIIGRFNSFAMNNQEKNFSICVEIELTSGGIYDRYEILRQWEYLNQNIKESYTVTINDKIMTAKEKLDFDSYIRSFLPPVLFDFFFFDGERIQDFLSSEDFEDTLKSSTLTLFNIDLFELLKNDIRTYLNQGNVFNNLSNEEKLKTILESKITNMENELKQLENKLKQIDSTLDNYKYSIKELENVFRAHGGLLAEERDKYKKDIIELEHKKNVTNEWIKEIIGSVLPFLITYPTLSRIKNQITLEDELTNYNLVIDKLHHDVLAQILFSSLSKLNTSENEKDSIITQTIDMIHNQIKPSFDIDNFKTVHKLSSDEKTSLLSVINQMETFYGDNLVSAFGKVKSMNKKIQNLRKKVEQSIDDLQLDNLLTAIREFNSKIEVLIMDQLKINQNIFNLKEDISIKSEELEKCRKQVIQAAKDKNIFRISEKIINVSNKFVKLQTASKLDQIRKNFQEMFSILIRKEDFVKEVEIKDDFTSIEMRNKIGQPIKMSNLSAGEKQIYLLSFLWALIKTSRREVPLVFDTLLGRLDHSHKENIIVNFLPHSSHQTIVLSTDSEIDLQYYQKLKPYIAREYLINYDEGTDKVNVSEKYFFRGELNAV
ncbi:MAG: DNA sulfur modification protein DndD [Carboxydocellales bacterium]